MRNFRYYIYIGALIVFLGCAEDKVLFTQYYENQESLMHKIIGDDLSNSCYYGYYIDGTLKYEFCLVDSLKQGIDRYYNEDGSLHTSAFFDKGQIVGCDTFFRNSGSINRIVSYRDGQPNGPIYIYQEDGKLKAYNLTHNGDIYYIKTYLYNDSDESVDSICTYNVVIHTNRDTFYTGDTMVVTFSLPIQEEPHGVEKFLLTFATDIVLENEALEPDSEPRTVTLQKDKIEKKYLMLEPGTVRVWGALNYEPASVKLKQNALSKKFIQVLRR